MSTPKIEESDIKKVVENVVSIEAFSQSGQKQVFKCTLKNGSITVLKFVHIETVDSSGDSQYDKSALERVLREVKIINSLETPYLPTSGSITPGYYRTANECFYYYSEEYISGESLRDMIKAGRFAISKTEQLLSNITNAIKILWENDKNIHRDIKPENIMYDKEAETFVLIDAGIALALYEVSLTPPGILIGTLPYMSPEQLKGKKRDLDFRSDLYSLGVVVYESITGKHPYFHRGMESSELMDKILMYSPPKLETLGLSNPPTCVSIVDRLMSKKPHMRYNACDKLLKELES